MRASLPTSIAELIGGTPTVVLQVDGAAEGATVAAKIEMTNPMGSVKDRPALWMLRCAEARGALESGNGTIIEATSGNTGIALAALAAVGGYRCIIVMPDSATVERIRLLERYGAEVVLTPGASGYLGAIARAEDLHASTPESWFPRQHENPDNPDAHYWSTGPELWADLGGEIDVFVCAVGTGGTLSGTARYLKERNPSLAVVAVEPERSAVLSGGPAGMHGIPGLNGGFVAPTTDLSVIDEVIAVSDEDARLTARSLARHQGLLVGISSGAAAAAAFSYARRPSAAGLMIATLFPDGGERYQSTFGSDPSDSVEPAAVVVGDAPSVLVSGVS